MRNAAVNHRDESDIGDENAIVARNTALDPFEITEHLRDESTAAAKAAQADKPRSDVALLASEAALGVSEAARRHSEAKEAAMTEELNALREEGS